MSPFISDFSSLNLFLLDQSKGLPILLISSKNQNSVEFLSCFSVSLWHFKEALKKGKSLGLKQ